MPPSTVPTMEPIKVLATILKSEMGIEDGQIMLGLENWEIPKTRGLYIALFYGPDKTVGQTNEFDPVSNTEIQSAAMLHEIVLEVMSFNEEARVRKQEVILALNSIFSQNTVDANGMQINSLPQSFLPVPTLEETKQLNKFRISFCMNALYQKVKPADYYDKFKNAEVLTDQ